MDNPTPTPTETPTTDPAPTGGTPAPAAAPAPKMLTQEQVDEIVQRRLAEDRARRERQVQPAPAPAPAAKPTPATPADEVAAMRADLEDLRLRTAFDKHVAKFALDEERADDLFDLYKSKRPTEPATWIESKVKGYGWNMPPQPTTPAPAATPASLEPPKPPAAAPGAPQPHTLPTNAGLVDIFNLSAEQFLQLRQSGGLRPAFEKVLSAANSQNGAPRRPTLPQK